MKKRRRKKAGGSRRLTANSPPTWPPCWSLANTTYLGFAANRSGVPDVAPGSSQDIVLEDVKKRSDADVLFASFFKDDCDKAGAPGGISKKFLRFVHQLTDNHRLEWDTVLFGNKLHVMVPGNLAEQGSRDSLVALLDAAEEHLGCTQVIVGLPRDIEGRHQLIRTFKFIGFELVPPGQNNLPHGSEDHLFMAYDI